jgi:hypothetical protein
MENSNKNSNEDNAKVNSSNNYERNNSLNQSIDNSNSSNKNFEIKKENNLNLNLILKEAQWLKSEYIKQKVRKLNSFEREEIIIKTEDLIYLYDFNDKQYNLIEVILSN